MMTSSMERFSVLLDLCEGNPRMIGGFPSQRSVTWTFDAFFDLRLNKWLIKQSRRQWFEMPSCSLWHHCNDIIAWWYDGMETLSTLLAFCEEKPWGIPILLWPDNTSMHENTTPTISTHTMAKWSYAMETLFALLALHGLHCTCPTTWHCWAISRCSTGNMVSIFYKFLWLFTWIMISNISQFGHDWNQRKSLKKYHL